MLHKSLAFLSAAVFCLALQAAASDKPSASLEWQKVNYPLDTCVVGGDKLGGMGKPYEHVHEGRLVMFCCKGCLKDFQKDPATYIKKLDEVAVAKQKADYPLDTCVVGGDKLGGMGKPYEFVHEGRLVMLCCKGCLKDFQKDPATYMKKLDEAAAAKAKAGKKS